MQFTAFLTGSMNGSVTRRQTRNPANGTAVGDAKVCALSDIKYMLHSALAQVPLSNTSFKAIASMHRIL